MGSDNREKAEILHSKFQAPSIYGPSFAHDEVNYRSARVVVGPVKHPPPPEEAGPRRYPAGKQIALLGYK